ncbi:U-box domain-containing protein [Striga asiatica]|uniref:RING-type E3 ubiquitin transferase n=1 Tax=Striga asiatica TaxID=4170 RepID=A0A5A7QUR7_STRAF|nr:U-box domain-containing protein [Striga asiatica]
MAAGEDTAEALRLVRDVVGISAAGFSGFFKKDCTDLARRVSLLAHLLEEIRDTKKSKKKCEVGSSSFSNSCFSDLILSLQAAKGLVFAANDFDSSKLSSVYDALQLEPYPHKKFFPLNFQYLKNGATKKIMFQFQCVTWKLEKALANLPYNDFDISEEVKEQVDLVTSQLRRATEKYGGPLNSTLLQKASSQPLHKDIDPFQTNNRLIKSLHVDDISNIDHDVSMKMEGLALVNHVLDEVCENKENVIRNNSLSCKNVEENKKSDSVVIPDDFRCPISLELMRDPVIVATGQTYERSYIQRWIDCGNTTCPKTQQKLHHLTLTPNYVLRSLISQWCLKRNLHHPTKNSIHNLSAFQTLVRRLSTGKCNSALSQIRSLSKKSTENRILLAEAGAIPILINLLTSENAHIQDNAVTCLLNLSIYENNKGLIMLANAIPSIVQLLRSGSNEARENSAATLFSLSLVDENKIIIGASGAISALVDLLENGSSRGKKDAATALFNLCIYHGNKGRAIRAGIINGLLKMLTDSNGCMVDEALTILSVLASHHEAKVCIVKAKMMPVLVGLLKTGLPRGKENAASVLLSLCKRDCDNLECLSGLGVMGPLMELVEDGTERAKRKASLLLEHLRGFQRRSC